MGRLPATLIGRLGDILATEASNSSDPSSHLRDLVQRTNLPDRWKLQLLGGNQRDLGLAARSMVRWADGKGLNSSNTDYTAVGSVLVQLLDDVGPDIGAEVMAVIAIHQLVRGSAFDELALRFPVPSAGGAMPRWDASAKPWIDDVVDLQAWTPPSPPLLDIGFLADGIRRIGGVCRIEAADGTAHGTGFLVGADLVLTVRHVVDRVRANDLRFRFHAVGAEKGSVVPAGPVVADSPVESLDFALLRFDRSEVEGQLTVLALRTGDEPEKGETLTVLQHPDGGPMKIATSADAVLRVYPQRHALRYASTTSGGSSGAPCFDDSWQVVALHRAERAGPIRTIREGVLIGAVADRIGEHI